MTDLEFELKREVENWVNREFNYIQLENFQIVQEHYGLELFEITDQPEPDYTDFIDNYSLWDEFWNWYFEDNEIEEADQEEEKQFAIESKYDQDSDTLKQFCEECQESQFEDWQSEREMENYPCWNTLFEFRSEPPNEWIDKAKKAGLSVFNSTDSYNTTLFATGAGYSFYGAHWIPLYLSLFQNEAKKYEGIKYDHF